MGRWPGGEGRGGVEGGGVRWWEGGGVLLDPAQR